MSRVWAIARNLLIEILRIKPLMIFLALVIFSYTFGFAWWLKNTNGMMDEKVQTFLSYSLSTTASILSLVTIFISVSTITRDIKRKEIFTITTKSISRGQYLFGKLIGMMLFNLLFLTVSAGLIYGLAKYLPTTADISDYERGRLNDLVFNARQGVHAEEEEVFEDVTQWVEEVVKQKIREEPHVYQNNPDLVNQMRMTLAKNRIKELKKKERTIAPGSQKVWKFTGVNPVDRQNGNVYVRFNQEVSSNPVHLVLYNFWMVGPKDPVQYGGTQLMSRDIIRVPHEFPVPVTAVSPEGEFYVLNRNLFENGKVSVVYEKNEDLEVLYIAGSFEANYLRALFLIYMRLLFLSIFGIAMGAWLSFPVAALLIIVVYSVGLASTFLGDAFKYEAGAAQQQAFLAVLKLFPRLAHYDPVPQIEIGRVVTGELIYQCLATLVFIKGGVLALFGFVVFKFKELARVIV